MKTNSRRPGGAAGFTLVELLVVISIAALMMTMAGVRLDGVTANARLRSSARRLGSTVLFLQNQSVVQGRYYFLQIDLDEHRYRAVIAPEYTREGMDVEGLTVDQPWKHLERGVQFEDLIFDDGEIRDEDRIDIPFGPTGMKWGFMVHLINEDGRRFTVEANSITGLVRHYPYYKEFEEIPEDLF